MVRSNDLEFLVPSYKRPESLINSVSSVAQQIQRFNLKERVKITVVDDYSPNVDIDEIMNHLSPFKRFISFTRNSANKGMSLNIRDMVANSQAKFCTILTDDDYLQPGSLKEMIENIDNVEAADPSIGCFFVPRYSYLEDNSLHCVACKPFNKDVLIQPSPLNSMRYLGNGFILTGLFFRPEFINLKLWDENIDNGYFPVIYFADLLLNKKCLFLNKKWFVHTVFNECHWEAWGKTEQIILAKLYTYYMKAVTISSQRAIEKASQGLIVALIFIEEFREYNVQMHRTLSRLEPQNIQVDTMTLSRRAYQLSAIEFRIFSGVRLRLRNLLSRMKHLI